MYFSVPDISHEIPSHIFPENLKRLDEFVVCCIHGALKVDLSRLQQMTDFVIAILNFREIKD